MTAVAIRCREQIIQQVAQGALLKHIAAKLGVTPAAISQHLANDPEYIAAREAGALDRLETNYEAIEGADDSLKLARAREAFRAASWFAEREFPARWGQKAQVTNINIDAGDWSDRLRRARERVISPDSHKESHTAIEHSAQPVESKQDSA